MYQMKSGTKFSIPQICGISKNCGHPWHECVKQQGFPQCSAILGLKVTNLCWGLTKSITGCIFPPAKVDQMRYQVHETKNNIGGDKI